MIQELSMIGWFIAVISIIATILNVKRVRFCFILWAITSASWSVIDALAGIYSQSALEGLYVILMIWGYKSWKTEKK